MATIPIDRAMTAYVCQLTSEGVLEGILRLRYTGLDGEFNSVWHDAHGPAHREPAPEPSPGSLERDDTAAQASQAGLERQRVNPDSESSSKDCCSAAMGNADFRAVQTGPLVEVPIEKIFLLVKGGYRNCNSFHS